MIYSQTHLEDVIHIYVFLLLSVVIFDVSIHQIIFTALIEMFLWDVTFITGLYCMPAEGVKLTKNDGILKTDEIIKIAELFVNEGVNKIRLTGGEPTVRKDIVDIIGKYSHIQYLSHIELSYWVKIIIIAGLKQLPNLKQVAITTNGLTLTRQLPSLQYAGLDAINISLDTLRENRFEQFTRRKGWSRVMTAIDLAIQLGYNPVKVRKN